MLAVSKDTGSRAVRDFKRRTIWKRFRLQGSIQAGGGFYCVKIAEGKERETLGEFVRHLYIGKGSAGELKTQLVIAEDIGYLDQAHAMELKFKVDKVSAMLGALIRTLKSE